MREFTLLHLVESRSAPVSLS